MVKVNLLMTEIMELLLQHCDTVHTSHLKDTWRKLGMDVLGTTSYMVSTAGMGSSCMFLITALGLMSCVYQWMLPSGLCSTNGEQSMVMFTPSYTLMQASNWEGGEASRHALCGTAIREGGGGGVGTCWSAVWATLRVELPFRAHWGRDQTTT